MRRFWGIVILLVCGGLAGLALWAVVWQHRAITVFIPVDAQVTSSSLGIHRGSKGSVSYSPDVSYTYFHNGNFYSSTRVLPFNEQSSRAWASGILSHFPRGRAVTAYIDPAQPSDAILWRVHSLTPYVFSVITLLGSFTGLFLAIGFLAGGRRQMLAVPLDGEGRHLLMPVLELRKQRRDWAAMWLMYTAVSGAVWGHLLAVAEDRSIAMWAITGALALPWLVLAIKTWRVWSTSRHVSDARVIVRPVPLKRGEPFEIRAEVDAYHALRVNHMRAVVVCTKHYKERRGSKTVYGTYVSEEKTAELSGGTEISAGGVLTGEGQVAFDVSAPASWDGGKKNYPYYTWELRLTVDLKGMVNYRGVFPLLVE